MPATKPLEWNIEELVIQKLKHDVRLTGKNFKHHDNRAANQLDALSVMAVKDQLNLDGVGGYNVTCSVTFQTSTLVPSEAEQLCLLISEVMYFDDPTFVPVGVELKFVSLEPETDTARVDTKKLRKRSVKFPFIAKLID